MFEHVSVEAPPSRLPTSGRALPRVGLAALFLVVGYEVRQRSSRLLAAVRLAQGIRRGQR